MLRMKAVVDTSTLISLAKIGFIDLMVKLKSSLIIPEIVYQEAVVDGEKKSFPDAFVIKDFIRKSNLKIITVKKMHIQSIRKKIGRSLAPGDEAVLACILQEKANEVITNDEGLGRIAMTLNVGVQASCDLLLQGLISGIMTNNEYEDYLRSLVIENRITSIVAEFYILEGKKYA
jgi:predicted nucleic acid-binding protein